MKKNGKRKKKEINKKLWMIEERYFCCNLPEYKLFNKDLNCVHTSYFIKYIIKE